MWNIWNDLAWHFMDWYGLIWLDTAWSLSSYSMLFDVIRIRAVPSALEPAPKARAWHSKQDFRHLVIVLLVGYTVETIEATWGHSWGMHVIAPHWCTTARPHAWNSLMHPPQGWLLIDADFVCLSSTWWWLKSWLLLEKRVLWTKCAICTYKYK